jgi:MFS family permease
MSGDRQDTVPVGQLSAVLRNGPFLRYLAGSAASLTGSWMQVMAQGWVMTTLTTSALMLGLVNFATGLPMLLLALKAGVLADRMDKRNILLAAQVLQIACALLVGWLVATGQVRVWHIVAVAFFLGLVFAFEMPAINALVPELVNREQIATGITLDRAVFHGTRLIGPAVAGYVVAHWGEATAFFVNAFSYLGLIAALLTIRLPQRSAALKEAVARGGIREGLSYARSDAPTLAMMALMALSTVVVFPVLVVLLPIYARHTLGLSPDLMGWLMGLTALGSFTGAVGLLAIPLRHRRLVFLVMVVGAGASLVGLAFAPGFWWAVPSLILLALCVSTLVGLAHIVIQERAPGELRGRISAIAGLCFFGLMPLASLALPGLADLLGLRIALGLGACVYIAVGLPIVLARGSRGWDIPRPVPPLAEPRTAPPLVENW